MKGKRIEAGMNTPRNETAEPLTTPGQMSGATAIHGPGKAKALASAMNSFENKQLLASDYDRSSRSNRPSTAESAMHEGAMPESVMPERVMPLGITDSRAEWFYSPASHGLSGNSHSGAAEEFEFR
ncbi:hypothetical protein [Nocardia jejuensis]|uniref:hypothetical protein n=1 Tax=Nocardia jejuensis TaxID=328049 RepID=UPI0012F848E9|nr:hypothetical protein [Nocardia jejuensis]